VVFAMLMPITVALVVAPVEYTVVSVVPMFVFSVLLN
jgi:hypothetical protein